MNIADAITAATGLIHGKDFEVRDIGDGPFLAVWNSVDVLQPDDVQLAQWISDYESTAKQRYLDATIKSRAMDYLIASIHELELGDATKINAIKADIAAVAADVVKP